MVKKNSFPMINFAIFFVVFLLFLVVSMGVKEKSLTASAVAEPIEADPAETAVSFIGLISIVSIIGLTLVSSLSLKILFNKKKKR